MFYATSYPLAVALCVVTMFCWGSWGNTQKLAGDKWPYKLFYWDYVLGMVLFALVWGLTAGSTKGGDWSFVASLKAASTGNLGLAFLSGVVFNAANILLVVAISMVGLSIAFPVGCGLSLVLGTVFNYLVDPKGSPGFLFTGLALLAGAIVLSTLAGKRKEAAAGAKSEAAPKSNGKGVLVSLACGVLMACFYPLLARTLSGDFAAAAPEAGKLTPYSGFFVFSLGVLASTFGFNFVSPARYCRGGHLHLAGLLGGAIWALGTGINFVAAGAAGAAIAFGLGQGATLVAALWGILVWREFKGAPRACALLNALMIVTFVAGLGLLVKAGG